MTDEEFNDLALRVAEGTANPAEREQFAALLADRPEWRESWRVLRRELEEARDAMTDTDELEGPSATIPAERLAQLMSEPPQRAPGRTWVWWLAGGMAAAASLLAVFVLRTDGPQDGTMPAPDVPRLAFVVPGVEPITVESPGRRLVGQLPVPLLGDETVTIAGGGEAVLLKADGTATKIRGTYSAKELSQRHASAVPRWFSVPLATLGLPGGMTRGSEGIRIFAPRGATASREPPLAWAAEPGKTYEIELTDALHPEKKPVRLNAKGSPVEFSRLGAEPLTTGGIYIFQVAEAGRPVTAVSNRFLVVPSHGEPAEAGGNSAVISAAFAAMNESPARSGDAWLLLQKLPADWRASELGWRLRVAISAQ